MTSESNKSVSRRSLIKAAAGLGAGAAVGLPAVVFLSREDSPAGGSQASAVAGSGTSNAPRLDQPLVAYVKDASTGEVVVMFGTTETVVRDPQLVARLAGVVQG